MPETSTTLGTPQDLPVRLGNTLRPVALTVRLRSGALDMTGGEVVTGLYLRATDMQPLASPNFAVTKIAPNNLGEPRFRLELSKEAVAELADKASDSSTQAKTRSPVRIVYWTASLQTASGERYPLRYGRILIVLGAASGG